jgi:hypothetical protein
LVCQLVELLLPFGLELQDLLNQTHACDLEGDESSESGVVGCLLDGLDETFPLLDDGVNAMVNIFIVAYGRDLLF